MVKLTGLPSLAYKGVEASSPPNTTIHPIDPTTTDYYNFNIGDFWLNRGTTSAPLSKLWVLTNKANHIATWVLIVNGAGGPVLSLHADDGNNAFPNGAGSINIHNTDANIVTTAAVANTVAIDLAPSIAVLNNITANTGDINALLGNSTIHGNITSQIGNITATAGNVTAANNVTAVTGNVTADVNITANTGDITATLGNITANVNITATTGNITATAGNVTAGLDLNSTAGDLNLPTTNALFTTGTININAVRFLHAFDNNVFLGQDAGNGTLTGLFNIGIGNQTLVSLTTGNHDVMVGDQSGNAITTGSSNTAVGDGTLLECTTGGGNTCMGASNSSTITTGGNNTLIGFSCCNTLATGSYNTAIGETTGISYTTNESSNILLAHPGVITENNTMHLGEHGAGNRQVNRCFIAGIRGITTGVADAIPVLIDSVHQLGTISSSRRYKDNIQDMGDQSSIIMKLRPVTFNYKKHPEVNTWGLIAEEVDEIFPNLVVYNENKEPETVKYHELIVLLLNEVQKLSKRIEELEKKHKRKPKELI